MLPMSTSTHANHSIQTEADRQGMRRAGRLAAQVLEMITPRVVSGVSTEKLNQLCHDYIVDELKAVPAPLNYRGFPKSICTSVNQQVCHGIPSPGRVLRNGDIVNIDITVLKDSYHGDTSQMFIIGRVPERVRRLVQVCQESLYLAIEQVRPGVRLGDIGHAIETHAKAHGLSVVRDYCGHGIGKKFHEPPDVLHFGAPGTGMPLPEGMTFTIEPMLNLGKEAVRLLGDGWTVVTRDRSFSAQWEHTLLITAEGVEVLTCRESENFDSSGRLVTSP